MAAGNYMDHCHLHPVGPTGGPIHRLERKRDALLRGRAQSAFCVYRVFYACAGDSCVFGRHPVADLFVVDGTGRTEAFQHQKTWDHCRNRHFFGAGDQPIPVSRFRAGYQYNLCRQIDAEIRPLHRLSDPRVSGFACDEK